ncbi:MAG: hypothetical protein JXR81_03110 [Candidatus Goldbacteria bacterium]|nr:hypothetical protein [Candidatus Goldiibacteriota bacterium]
MSVKYKAIVIFLILIFLSIYLFMPVIWNDKEIDKRFYDRLFELHGEDMESEYGMLRDYKYKVRATDEMSMLFERKGNNMVLMYRKKFDENIPWFKEKKFFRIASEMNYLVMAYDLERLYIGKQKIIIEKRKGNKPICLYTADSFEKPKNGSDSKYTVLNNDWVQIEKY